MRVMDLSHPIRAFKKRDPQIDRGKSFWVYVYRCTGCGQEHHVINRGGLVGGIGCTCGEREEP